MGRPGITQSDVERAAIELKNEGKNPTVDNVRALLGTGSKSTITRHLREWKNQQKPKQANIPDDLQYQMIQLWEKMNAQVLQNKVNPENISEIAQKNSNQSISQSAPLISSDNDPSLGVALRKCKFLEQQISIQQQKINQLEKILLQKNTANQIQEQRINSLLNQLRESQLLFYQLKKQLNVLQSEQDK